jgi:hypothetical protein
MKFLTAIALITLITACSQGGSSGGDVLAAKANESVPEQNAPYHQIYSSVSQVLVNVRSVYVRTSEGTIIDIPNSAQSLDLLQLSQAPGGVHLLIPGETGTSQPLIVEVGLRLHDEGHNQVTYADGSQCKLKTKKNITLFARNALLLDVGVPYLVHAEFDPLEALDLDGNSHGNCQSHGHDHGKRCELANTRFEITGVEFDASQGGNL